LTGLHMTAEATEEFRLANTALAKDPWALLELSLQLNGQGLYQPAVSAATALLSQSPTAWAAEAPESMQRLLYPYPYRALIEQSAKQYNIDPLLLASLVRQESLFAARATSRSDARGLAQVIPPTAREIAGALGTKDFRIEDLYRPRLSLTFGAFYLSEMLRLAKGNVWMALASYNGGYTNALRWAGGQTTTDQDLFLESITYSESQTYVQAISRNLRFYRPLYGP
jgi:soluble lytic murein transglycosylase